ncbi:Glycerol-3-phosphate acyltransferase, chloroplastic [Sesamum angolense]|uniref:glycerol-3-phosphate 1-O-acyltransferase n=1 Tax=Sesamum angolense TaxID=2727404 RepID=A0AAE1WAG5_9LAMI|nr:Glycerol-3-phosphate acyltransferase, chloroplastic [Sesamum angolense]
MIFSTTCSTTLFTCSTTPRVSASPSTSRPACLLKSGCGGASRRSRSSFLVLCASKLSEAIDGKKSSTSSTVAAAPVFASSSAYDQDEISAPRTFLDARTEQAPLEVPRVFWEKLANDLLTVGPALGIQKEAEAGRLPINVAQGMEELYHNYRNAVFHSGHPKAHEIVFSNMAVALDRIFMDVRDPFGLLCAVTRAEKKGLLNVTITFISSLLWLTSLPQELEEYRISVFLNSFLGNISLFNEMEKKLQQVHILLSFRQSLLRDRVVTDPLCKPFSMGRNLLCVYSKKHLNDDPELIDMKRRANTKSLKEMAMLLRAGSKIIWIAPSGGRDRPDPVTKEWYPAPFDASSVDNMRRLVEHAGVPGHIYPLAILCYDVMPLQPRLEVEKEIGEKRVISFHGVGLSVAPEISYKEITATLEDPEVNRLIPRGYKFRCRSSDKRKDLYGRNTAQAGRVSPNLNAACSYAGIRTMPLFKIRKSGILIDRAINVMHIESLVQVMSAKDAFSELLYYSVCEQYNVLTSAIHGKQGLAASTPTVSLSQPWE